MLTCTSNKRLKIDDTRRSFARLRSEDGEANGENADNADGKDKGTCGLSVPVVIVWAAPPGDPFRMDDLEHLHLHGWLRAEWSINYCLLHGLWW